MAKDSSKQQFANLIQAYQQVLTIARQMYFDDSLIKWAQNEHSFFAQDKIFEVKKMLNETFSIDYDSEQAKNQIVKEGSIVEVFANHMPGMVGSTAIIKSYSLPANLSDITMKDGMKMNNHKWMTNDEVKLK